MSDTFMKAYYVRDQWTWIKSPLTITENGHPMRTDLFSEALSFDTREGAEKAMKMEELLFLYGWISESEFGPYHRAAKPSKAKVGGK